MAVETVRPGIWGQVEHALAAQPSGMTSDPIDVWSRVGAMVDPGGLRPKLSDDIEIKEFKLRWGNDYAMIANPRDLVHYQLKPWEIEIVRLMDGTRTVQEIVVERLEASGDLELSGVADLVHELHIGNFLEDRFLDVETAVERAIKPMSRPREAASQFAKSFRIDWRGADRFVRFMHDHLLKWFMTPWAIGGFGVVSVAGLLAFISLVDSHRFTLSGKSLAVGFLILLLLNYLIIFVHEMGHASMLVHYGRRVKSAGFMLFFGSPAFFVESSDGLMLERRQRIAQAFAGAYAELIFSGTVALIAWAFPDSALAPVLYRFCVLNYLICFLNLVPLLELDGYWILSDWIQVPDLRPRSLAFVRHDLWHKLRRRQRLSRQELGLTFYGVLGILFTILAFYVATLSWRTVFGSLVRRLWDGGAVTRILLAVLALVVAGPVIRGLISLLRALAQRIRARWQAVSFRLQTKWRVEAAQLIDAMPLFDDVPEDVLSDLAGRVRMRSVARGQPVVRQGERAEAFFVVRKGTLQVIEEDPVSGNQRPLRVLGRGEGFGEVGLAESSPRTATVRALEESQVFEIDKGTFDQLLRDMAHIPGFAPTLQAVAELKEMGCFAQLEPDELSELLRHGEWVTRAPGEAIITQGDVGEVFYAIRTGQVEILQDGRHIRNMGPGSYFGEVALLLDSPRTATVRALTPVRLYQLDREGFDRLIRDAFRKGTLNPAISPDRVWQH
jgi:putative peptide zinc metalloprotease protein